MKLIFATNNQHKIDEVQALLSSHLELITLQQAGIEEDIPEPHDTLEENAKEKAITIFHRTNLPCFGEDTGLEVHALDGEPGVRSARYAGDEKLPQRNTEKLLRLLATKDDRTAQFRTVVCLILEGNIEFIEGVCKGRITTQPQGGNGFGYDPVFIPDGANKTFAEMSREEKNRFSHRRKAIDRLVAFLNQSGQNK